jgi:hypothetical protein
MLCWIFPRSRKAHAWRRHSGLATASHCTGFRSAATTSVPAQPGGARSSMRTFRPAAPAARPRLSRARNPCWAHNDCRQPFPPPQGALTDGVVSLRVPPAGDAGTFVSYAAGQDGGLGDAWLPSLCSGASREGCLWMVADWLPGWAGEGSYNGPALLLTIAQRPWPAGMVGFVWPGCGHDRACPRCGAVLAGPGPGDPGRLTGRRLAYPRARRRSGGAPGRPRFPSVSAERGQVWLS